jgi:hypothetical protein
VRLDVQFVHHTVGESVPNVSLVAGFRARGKVSGHGTVSWAEIAREEALATMLPQAPWPPRAPSPVIALVDTGVHPHSWLPAPTDPPFCRTVQWTPARDIPEPAPADAGSDFGTHWGHGTFIAGLIRQHAPTAQLLSLRVMDDNGRASECNVVRALNHLLVMTESQRIDVVLMAFGRPKDADDDEGDSDVAALRQAVQALAGKGVTLVVSAGNDGSAHPTLPAGLADEPDLSVVSVGAGNSELDHAAYSNHGSWVKQWRSGSDVVSTMPLRQEPDLGVEIEDGNGYARWSGTSFAAAIFAAGEAQRASKTRRRAAATGS